MNEILAVDDDIQQYLQGDHYSFVGPVDQNLMERFIKTVNQIAPTSFFSTIHDALSNRAAARQALQYFPGAEFQVYVMMSRDPTFLLPASVHEYFKRMNIHYP